MDDYKKEYRRVEIRKCETHTNQIYSLACDKCHQVFCATCVALTPDTCSEGMYSICKYTILQNHQQLSGRRLMF